MGDGVEVELVIPAGPAPTPTVSEPARPAPAPGGLPHTGVDVVSVVLLAAILIALGVLLALHRPITRRSS